MLDERSKALLSAVNDCCGEGFKIIDEGELVRLCPPAEGEVDALMEHLEERGFIELRYKEGGIYCVRPLPAGKSYAQQEARERSERTRLHRESVFFAALGGFLGALIAVLLAGGVAFLL